MEMYLAQVGSDEDGDQIFVQTSALDEDLAAVADFLA